ncbi:hypothetical protein DO73_5537 [Burkholderia pseudomallei]|nr:hypothetical protein DO73_5537 [Burkholderia pseudomallei]KGD51780.1 hypothetical protein DP43_5707 [Burkholderia pseudomallei]
MVACCDVGPVVHADNRCRHAESVPATLPPRCFYCSP